jgi:DNA polymerase-3 subunit alpha
MSGTDFCHLHVHSHYSLLDGANRIDDLVAAAVKDGQPALALTDHGNMFGAIELYKKCRAAGIKPIVGCEIYLSKGSHREKHHKTTNPYFHLTLLARNEVGYKNLVQIASEAFVNGYSTRPRVDKAFLAQHAAGITALSGCLSGEVNRLFLDGQEEAAVRAAGDYQDIFGKEHFYLELQRNGIQIQTKVNEEMVRLHQRTAMPLVATNDIHYLRKEDCQAHDVLLCIQTNSKVNDEKRWRMDTDTLWFHTGEQMKAIFRDLPEAVRNTVVIAEQIDLQIQLGKYRVPKFVSETKESSEELFRRLCGEGFRRLYPAPTAQHHDRLEMEIEVIKKMGFIDYFLIVWDFIRHSRSIGVPVGPGRGSAAGSIVAYCLGITQVDPIKYDLLFERFLNSERISMPDIDIDFCRDGREKVIQYVRQRYGEECVAQIITFNTMASRLAVRDVGRALDIPLPEVDRIAKKVPDGPGASLKAALETDAELKEIQSSNPEYARLLDTATFLEGLARHAGVHAAGVVIGDSPLKDLVPLYRNKEDITTQYPMTDLEDVGLLKMDFLGLKTLTVLEKAVELIARHRGEQIVLDTSAFDDPKTYELLSQGKTLGVFQLESEGMRKLLQKLKPDCFEDIIAVLALYRPGPLGSGMVDTFVECKHGRKAIKYLHPALEQVLKETYGVIVYQEQVMRITNVLAGFSLNEADGLRKAMGKKKPEIMAKYRQKFIDGAGSNGVSKKVAEEIWTLMEFFGGYGFNKSHTTAYAILTYQTAWLRANYATEFLAANMTCESTDTDKVKEFLDECRTSGIEIRPPDVNRSQKEFDLEEASIRYSLEAIKGLGSKPVEAILAARATQTPPRFRGLKSFCRIIDPTQVNKLSIEALVKAGAFDFTGWDRGVLFAEIEDAMALGAERQRDERAGQGNLFDLLEEAPTPAALGASAPTEEEEKPSYPAAVWSARERLIREREAIGFYLSSHPTTRVESLARALRTSTVAEVDPAAEEAVLVGLVNGLSVRIISKGRFVGQKMARFVLEDTTGTRGVVVFAELYNRIRDMLQNDLVVSVRGKVSRRPDEEGPPEIIAEQIEPLEHALRAFNGVVEIRVRPEEIEKLPSLVPLCERYPGSRPILFELELAPQPRRVRSGPAFRVHPSEGFLEDVQKILGADRVALRKLVAHRR